METVPVRISKRQLFELEKISLENGPTISWQVAYAIDLYLQDLQESANKQANQPFDWEAEGYACASLHRIAIAGCKDCERR